MPSSKRCRRCGDIKPPDAFRPTPANRDGLDSWCKQCRSEYARAWKNGHPSYFRTYYQQNRPTMQNRPHLAARPCAKESCSESRHVSRTGFLYPYCEAHIREHGRAAYRRKHAPYQPVDPWQRFLAMRGMTVDGYAALLDAQDGKCRICDTTEGLVLDHDHACCDYRPTLINPWCGRCIRGLLCPRCNWAIGHLRDDSNLAARAVAYLIPEDR